MVTIMEAEFKSALQSAGPSHQRQFLKVKLGTATDIAKMDCDTFTACATASYMASVSRSLHSVILALYDRKGKAGAVRDGTSDYFGLRLVHLLHPRYNQGAGRGGAI